jgi:CRP/FNR family transcriptional regulator, cyclic AMP receptor protein
MVTLYPEAWAGPRGGLRRRFGDRLSGQLRIQHGCTSSLQLQRGDYLYTSGECDRHVYLIEGGRLKTLMHSPSGKGCLLGIYSRGDVVGESCLAGAERTETAVAMLPTVVTRIARDAFVATLSSVGLLEDWLTYQAAKFVDQQEMITLLVTVDSEHRLAVILQRLARDLGARRGDHIRIDQKLTHEELSDMVGTTRSRIGFFLKKFRLAGLLDDSCGSHLVIVESRLDQYVRTRSQLPVDLDRPQMALIS